MLGSLVSYWLDYSGLSFLGYPKIKESKYIVTNAFPFYAVASHYSRKLILYLLRRPGGASGEVRSRFTTYWGQL